MDIIRYVKNELTSLKATNIQFDNYNNDGSFSIQFEKYPYITSQEITQIENCINFALLHAFTYFELSYMVMGNGNGGVLVVFTVKLLDN